MIGFKCRVCWHDLTCRLRMEVNKFLNNGVIEGARAYFRGSESQTSWLPVYFIDWVCLGVSNEGLLVAEAVPQVMKIIVGTAMSNLSY